MTWQEPKTDWVANPKNPEKVDFNRIEGNIHFLKDDIETKKGLIVDAIQDMNQSAEITDTHAQLASKIRDINMPNRTGHVTAQSAAVSGNTLRLRPQAGYYPGDAANSVQLLDNNWIPANIAAGVNVFGKVGTANNVSILSGTNNLIVERANVGSTTSTSYVEVRRMIIYVSGTVIASFEMYSEQQGSPVYGRIYRNGVAVGTEFSVSNSVYNSFSPNISVSANDLIQLYVRVSAGRVYYRNFQVRCNIGSIGAMQL